MDIFIYRPDKCFPSKVDLSRTYHSNGLPYYVWDLDRRLRVERQIHDNIINEKSENLCITPRSSVRSSRRKRTPVMRK